MHYRILDTIISSINNRYFQAHKILKDLSLLSSERLLSFKNENEIPNDAFKNISNWIPAIEQTQLKNEYITFSKSIHLLIDGMNLEAIYQTNNQHQTSDFDSDNSEINEDILENSKNKITSLQIIKI